MRERSSQPQHGASSKISIGSVAIVSEHTASGSAVSPCHKDSSYHSAYVRPAARPTPMSHKKYINGVRASQLYKHTLAPPTITTFEMFITPLYRRSRLQINQW